jgi:hypothetical protein
VESGRYTFSLIVTSIDDKGKTIEDLFVRVTRPDLRFYTNITSNPTSPTLGDPITFEAMVYNNGSSKLSGFFIEFKVKGSIIDIKPIMNLSAGDFQRVFFNWSTNTPGNFLLEFVIDPYNDILEENKDNNKISFVISFNLDIAILKDPVFSDNNPTAGDKVIISATIENIGNVDTTKPFQVDFYDGDPDSDGSRFARYTIVEPLAVDNDEVVTVTWTAEDGKKDHTIYVVLNPERNFTEIDYDNNLISKTILVLKAAESTEVDDYSAWIITIVFVIAILIILFLFFSPTKQPSYRSPKRRSDLRYKKTGDSFASGKSRSEKAKYKRVSGDVKFIELEEEDVIPDDYGLDEDEVEAVDSDDEEEDMDIDSDFDSKRRVREDRDRVSRVRGKRSKKPPGLFSSLLLGGSRSGKKRYTIKKRQRDRPTRSKDRDRLKNDLRKKSKAKSGRSLSKKEMGDTDEDAEDDVAVVQVIGEGELDEHDEDGYYEDDKTEEPDELEEEIKYKRKQKPKNKSKDRDMSWEYSQLIGIR